MKKRFLLTILLLCLACAAALAEDDTLLGQPFPDFTATDTQGNAFTLSQALKTHRAAVVNLWATWCPPCRKEFPLLDKAWAHYADRVAFIALSTEPKDTLEVIEAYRQENGLALPMGRDEGLALKNYVDAGGVPVTLVVDRFGNVAYVQVGAFSHENEIYRVLDACLGDDYAETVTMTEVPRDSATKALPLFATRALRLENEGARRVVFHLGGDYKPLEAWVIDGGVAHLRLEPGPDDDPGALDYYNSFSHGLLTLADLLDAQSGVYTCEQPVEGFCVAVLVGDDEALNDDEVINGNLTRLFLINSEANIQPLADLLTRLGYGDVTWAWEEATAEAEAEAPGAYRLHAMDQFGAPVKGVIVKFCTDTSCTMRKSDAGGVITFDGAPDVYHVELLSVPDGYGFDEGFELYTDRTYGEWVLRVRKAG